MKQTTTKLARDLTPGDVILSKLGMTSIEMPVEAAPYQHRDAEHVTVMVGLNGNGFRLCLLPSDVVEVR